jgi:hypothetical protein
MPTATPTDQSGAIDPECQRLMAPAVSLVDFLH